jgi:phosphohistidine phosphatase SixA
MTSTIMERNSSDEQHNVSFLLSVGASLGGAFAWTLWQLKRNYDKKRGHHISDPLSYEECKRKRLPGVVILVRHGESEGNIDVTQWWMKPDNKILLTPKGREQAVLVGQRIENIFQHHEHELGTSINRVHIHASPFERTMETARLARLSFEHRVVRQNVCPRLREQEFGNTQSTVFKAYREEQKRVGRFWYRFPTGESGADGMLLAILGLANFVNNKRFCFLSSCFHSCQCLIVSNLGGTKVCL